MNIAFRDVMTINPGNPFFPLVKIENNKNAKLVDKINLERFQEKLGHFQLIDKLTGIPMKQSDELVNINGIKYFVDRQKQLENSFKLIDKYLLHIVFLLYYDNYDELVAK